MNSLDKVEDLAMSGSTGLCWGTLAGEAQSDKYNTYLAADGISNVLTIFEDLEHDKLNGVDFIELYACSLGCVGGTLNIESPYLFVKNQAPYDPMLSTSIGCVLCRCMGRAGLQKKYCSFY